jgi:hypothetical protein
MATPIAELLVVIGIDHEKAEKAIEAMTEKVKENFKEMGKHVLEFLGVVGSMEAFASFFENTIQGQVAIQRLSQEAHIGSAEISAMQIAAEKFGGSAEGVNNSISTLGEKLSVLGTKMRGARMAGMALGMALGLDGKAAEEAAVKLFKGKGPIEAMDILAEKLHGMDFFKAKKIGAMVGIDEATIRIMVKTKEEYDEIMEHAKRFAATQEETEASEHFEEAQKDIQAALHKVGMVIVEYILPAMQWMADKLVLVTEYAADHARVAQTVTWILVGLGAAFIGAAGNAAAGWAWMQLSGDKGLIHVIGQWFAAGKSAEVAGAEFEGAAIKSNTSWISMAGKAIAHAATVVAGWAATGAKAVWAGMKYVATAAMAVASWIGHAAAAVFNTMIIVAQYIWIGMVAMATGIKMAAAWIIGLGPIAWIIAGIAAIIAIIVALEMKFHFFEAAWGWIKTAASDALGWIWDKLKAIGQLLMDYVSIWGKLLTGDFKGAFKAGINVVHDYGKILGFGETKGNAGGGLEPAYAGAGGASPAPEHTSTPASHPVHVTAHVTAHVTPRDPATGTRPQAQEPPPQKHVVSDEEFNKAWEAHHVMRMNAPAAAHAADSIGASAVVSPAMVSQSTSNATSKKVDRNVTIGEINIHTQATDAKGIAGSVGGALENTVNNSDGMSS